MSSDVLQSVLTNLRLNNYTTLVVLTAVGYDYILTFSDEVEYIWTKPWTWVSTLFILVRYAGLWALVLICLRKIMTIMEQWVFVFFLGAAEFVMILRVWVMYNRSKLVLNVLLASFCLEMILIIVTEARFSNAGKMMELTVPILNLPICDWYQYTYSATLSMAANVIQMMYGALLCILAIARFLVQSVRMYRATKQWQINRYMTLFAKQGILYFLGIFFISLFSLLPSVGNFPTGGWQLTLLNTLEYVPAFTLTPRLVLSVRALYARDIRVGGSGIDTGFGLSSGRGGCETAIMFADVELEGRDREAVEPEEVPRDSEGGTVRRVGGHASGSGGF